MRFLAWLLAVLLVACAPRNVPVDSSSPPPFVSRPSSPAPVNRSLDASRSEPPPPSVRIIEPPPIPPQPGVDIDAVLGELSAGLHDAYFDYDRFDLRPDAVTALLENAMLLKAAFSAVSPLKVIVEGHADDRGSAEYNLALGDQRARRAASFLAESGVPSTALELVSYGREKPQCTEPVESCWQRNRRAHLRIRHAGAR